VASAALFDRLFGAGSCDALRLIAFEVTGAAREASHVAGY